MSSYTGLTLNVFACATMKHSWWNFSSLVFRDRFSSIEFEKPHPIFSFPSVQISVRSLSVLLKTKSGLVCFLIHSAYYSINQFVYWFSRKALCPMSLVSSHKVNLRWLNQSLEWLSSPSSLHSCNRLSIWLWLILLSNCDVINRLIDFCSLFRVFQVFDERTSWHRINIWMVCSFAMNNIHFILTHEQLPSC